MHTSSLPSWKIVIAILGVFASLSLVTYGSTLDNEFVTWDDTLLISQNINVHSISPTTLKTVFSSYDPELYIPLTFVSYQIDWWIGGGSVLPFRITNLALHVINALLVTFLLFELIGSGSLAIAGGLLFLVHPLNTEAVAWAAGRKDVLAAMFFLSALAAYIRFLKSENERWYWSAFTLFICALLSKIIAATLPVAVLLLILWVRPLERKDAVRIAPFFGVSVLFGIIAIFGKTSILAQSTLVEKFLMAAKSTVFYIGALVWPVGLSPMYPYTKAISALSSDFWLPLAIMAAASVVAIGLLKRAKSVAICLALFLITLAPTFLNFAKTGDVYVASDRYAYIPMLWVLLLLMIAVHWLYEALPSYRRISAQIWGSCVAALLIIACVLATRAQSAIWQNSRTLYEHVVAQEPLARAAHTNLGMEYLQAGLIDEAIGEFRSSLELKDDVYTRADLAAAYIRKGLTADAIREYQIVIAQDPKIADAYYGLGTIAQGKGNEAEAMRQYRLAIEKDAHHSKAHNNLGGMLASRKQWKEAAQEFTEALSADPQFFEAALNLGIAEEKMGDIESAIAAYEQAVAMDGKSVAALGNLAWAYERIGQIQDAGRTVERLLLIDPQNAVGLDLVRTMRAKGEAK